MFGTISADAGSVKLSAIRKIEAIRSSDLASHEAQVARVCELLCRAVGIDDHFVAPLKLAAELHDIGKLGISDSLLNKPAALTADEMTAMRDHALLGYEVLGGSNDPILDLAANIARSHHECFDGSGYPEGLKGEAIPLGSRLVALCDVYDALRADRSYRAGMTHEQTLAVMTARTGRASRRSFDPTLLRAFVHNAAAVVEIYATRPGDAAQEPRSSVLHFAVEQGADRGTPGRLGL